MGVEWLRSTRCESNRCVEVADFAGDVLIRDSKLGKHSPVLRFDRDEWRAFVDDIAELDKRLSGRS